MPKVYNKYHNNAPNGSIYIGRGSPYGNPFPITKTDDRDAVCDKFEQLVESSTELKAKFISELKNKDLVCFCAPKRCHGDYLLKIANEV